MRVWRVVHRRFLDEAWTGRGANIYGGRWNHPGVNVVYTSEQPALAVLEVLAGGIKPQDLADYALLSAEVPDDAIVDMHGDGPERDRGAAWLKTGTLACRVPSAVVPGTNVLLNPASKDWSKVKILSEAPIDPRLWS